VFLLLDNDRAAETLSKVAPDTNRYLLQALPTARALDLLRRLPMDEAAEVVSENGEDGERLLALMPGSAGRDVERLLEYRDQTSGQLMTTKFAAVPVGVTVATALEYLRAVATTVETVNTVDVVDEGARVVGVCSIRDLLIGAGHDAVDAIMRRDVITVTVDTDQLEVADVIAVMA